MYLVCAKYKVNKVQSDRTKKLVLDFRNWCVSQNIKFAAAARMLELQPNTLSEILNGRNNFSGDTTLRVLELIRTGKNMKSPRNLNEASELLDAASEQIQTLTAEVARLKAAPSPPAAATAPTPPLKIEQREIAIPIMAKKAPTTAVIETTATAAGVVRHFSQDTELGRLSEQITYEKDPAKIQELYLKIKSLRAKRP